MGTGGLALGGRGGEGAAEQRRKAVVLVVKRAGGELEEVVLVIGGLGQAPLEHGHLGFDAGKVAGDQGVAVLRAEARGECQGSKGEGGEELELHFNDKLGERFSSRWIGGFDNIVLSGNEARMALYIALSLFLSVLEEAFKWNSSAYL